MGYIAFVIDEASRQRSLENYSPVYPRIIAHHVTLKFGVQLEDMTAVKAAYGNPEFITVRGYACDENTDCIAVITDTGYGVQDSSDVPLHITLSVADGSSPVKAGTTARSVVEACGTMVLTGSVQYVGF